MPSAELSGAQDQDGVKFAGGLTAGDVEALAESLAEGMAKKAVAHMKTLKP